MHMITENRYQIRKATQQIRKVVQVPEILILTSTLNTYAIVTKYHQAHSACIAGADP